MNRLSSRRAFAALGVSMALAMAAGVPASAAQTAPRALPANPQNQDRAPDPQRDRQFDPRDDRQFGGPFDPRDRFGPRDTRDPRDFDARDDRLERRLAFLYSELRIAPAQEGAWRAFTDAVRDEARMRDGIADRDRAPSVVERLEERQRVLMERSEGLDRIVQALRPLYASFSADQKRTADREMFQADGGRFAGRFGGRGFGFPRGGPGFDRDGRFGRPDFRDFRDYR